MGRAVSMVWINTAAFSGSEEGNMQRKKSKTVTRWTEVVRGALTS